MIGGISRMRCARYPWGVPIYEYDCRACGRRFSLLIGMVAQPDEERCPHCSASEIARRVSRFRRLRTEGEKIDEISDRIERMGEPETAGQMRSLVKDLGDAGDEGMGEDLEEMLELDLEGKGEPD